MNPWYLSDNFLYLFYTHFVGTVTWVVLFSDGKKNNGAQSDAKVEIIDFAQLSMQVKCISFQKLLLVEFSPKLLENLDKWVEFQSLESSWIFATFEK